MRGCVVVHQRVCVLRGCVWYCINRVCGGLSIGHEKVCVVPSKGV